MQTRRQRPATPPSPERIKSQLEAVATAATDVSPEQLIRLRYPAGSYAYFGQDEDSTATWRNLFFPGKYCNFAPLLDAAGASFTGNDGKRVFLLSDVVCFSESQALSEPINIVVTPRSENPVFVSMTYSLIPSAPNSPYDTDLQITVFAWDSNGAPAPNVSFHWRCRVVASPIIL